MDIITALVLIGGVATARVAWQFFVLPNRSHVSLGGYRWAVEGENLIINDLQNKGQAPITIPLANVSYDLDTKHDIVDRHRGASSHSTTVGTIGPAGLITGQTHTTHIEAMSWKEKGASYRVASIYDFNQEYTNKLMLLGPTNDSGELGFEDAKLRNAHDVISQPAIRLRLSNNQGRLLARWLKRNGMSEKPDNSAKESRFKAETGAIQQAFRNRFGYQQGELDYLVLNAKLEPVSYTRLSADGKLLAYHVANEVTEENIIRLCYLDGVDFGKMHYRQGVLLKKGNEPGKLALVSRAMWEAIEPQYKSHDRTLSYRRMAA